MNDNITFSYNIDLTWSIVKHIRDNIESIVEAKDPDLADACKMTASELVENAVKYGCSAGKTRGIEFHFSINSTEARIVVSNGIIHHSDVENVKFHIDAINASESPQDLYIQRLNTLLENPELNQSQLGLYRIAFEGEFCLSYEHDEQLNVLTITATKQIQD